MEAQEIKLKLALFFWLSNSVLAQMVPLSSNSERAALFELRSSLGLRARDWPRKVDPCANWTGVQCQNGRVVGINISGLRRTHNGRRNPRFAVDSLATFTLLASFNASGFLLPGSIPDWFGQNLSALHMLDLRSCSIIGPIPSSLGSLSGLNSIYLSNNSLTGIIPSSLGQLSSLSVLDLSGNLLAGSIPSAFSTLHNLTNLNLSSNYLYGPIPPGLGSLIRLQYLNLNYNSLTGPIPPQLGNLSQLIELDVGLNSLSGSLPEALGGLIRLHKLSVGNNVLEGPLSGRLFSNLTQLRYVVLSRNHFDGNFSDALSAMSRLLVLDIAGNNFTGVLPNLTFLSATNAMFNFSYNLFYGNLSFQVPNFRSIDLSNNYFLGSDTGTNVLISRNCLPNLSKQRSLDDCRLFYEKRGLTFYDDGAQGPTQPLAEPASNRRSRLIYIIVGLFGGVGFIAILVVVLVLILKTCNKNKGNADQGGVANMGQAHGKGSLPPDKYLVGLSGTGESFTYEQILKATGDFSDANLIKHGHSGDLFRGTLEGGFPVVIKRIDSLRKEFYMMELEFFSKTSHLRLVPLLGHCLELENEKLLVYKYMPNRDLSNSLYRVTNLEDDGLQSLDWITRLKIAIGAAEGLSYLHHECSPPLVHRDIQASSILLDDKYEVYLGSLSEVCSEGSNNNHSTISRLLRMPETSEQGPSGSSSATCAYDVYCFGNVLLELVTGKLGISKSDDATTRAWLEQSLPFISIHERELLSKIVDQSLVVDEDLLEEVWAVSIVAKSCLNPKPSKRPLMRHVLRALENPLKVIREETYSSAKLRTTSSRGSWSSAFFGSWNRSSSGSGNATCPTNVSGLKQSGRVSSHGSGANDLSSSHSHKRLSNEIFPEPVDVQDLEKQDLN